MTPQVPKSGIVTGYACPQAVMLARWNFMLSVPNNEDLTIYS